MSLETLKSGCKALHHIKTPHGAPHKQVDPVGVLVLYFGTAALRKRGTGTDRLKDDSLCNSSLRKTAESQRALENRKINKKAPEKGAFLAEMEGLEPSRQFPDLRP